MFLSPLLQVLQNLDEHPMVRHEAAEALGAIATPEAMDLLGQFLTDKEPAVKESCVVGTSCTTPSFHVPNNERFLGFVLLSLTRPTTAMQRWT
jgi:HEAT repeat protein